MRGNPAPPPKPLMLIELQCNDGSHFHHQTDTKECEMGMILPKLNVASKQWAFKDKEGTNNKKRKGEKSNWNWGTQIDQQWAPC